MVGHQEKTAYQSTGDSAAQGWPRKDHRLPFRKDQQDLPLHIGKGRTESRAISDIIDYVANPQKTDNGKLITSYGCDSRTADAEFLLAKRQYIAATGRVRGADDVIAYHVRQSFKPGEITPEEANRLGVEFAKRFTKDRKASCRERV